MSMSYWNYRIVRRIVAGLDGGAEEWLGLHEVYYPDGEEPAVTKEPVAVEGETLQELRATLQRMLRSLDRPVLEFDGFGENDPDSEPTAEDPGSTRHPDRASRPDAAEYLSFDEAIAQAEDAARRAGLTPEDIEKAIREVRARR